MHIVCWLILMTGAYPLWLAWLANRRSSLIQTVHWLIVAWAAWEVALVMQRSPGSPGATAGCYLALCLTGCAAIAVLGARRPGVTAWNFVVLALLALNSLPLAEGWMSGRGLHFDVWHIVCVAATVAVAVLNYLPTRLAPAALMLLVGCGLELLVIASGGPDARLRAARQVGWLAIAFVPWVAFWALYSRPLAASRFDEIWLAYRNRFGLVWAQRLREQFNRSAANAGWPVLLRWQGLHLLPGAAMPQDEEQTKILETLRALMKRFGREEDDGAVEDTVGQSKTAG